MMGKTMKRCNVGLLSMIVLSLGLVSCDSSKTHDSDAPGGQQFVDSDDSTGTITLRINDDPISVGDTATFSVNVRDDAGNPVQNVQVACDSEQGVAIIEPVRGFEMTDSFGHMSGVIGCSVAASLQLGCRVTAFGGAGKRDFKIVHCVGDTPVGFTGFPGAAGGGLGGGVDVGDIDTGDAGGLDVRITSINIYDDGSTGNTPSPTVDVSQGTCTGSSGSTPEDFFNTFVGITIKNNSDQLIRLRGYNYTIQNVPGSGNVLSSFINFIGEVRVLAGDDAEVTALFTDIAGTGKSVIGNAQIGAIGVKNVRFAVEGIAADGQEIREVASTAISFNNYNNCPDA